MGFLRTPLLVVIAFFVVGVVADPVGIEVIIEESAAFVNCSRIPDETMTVYFEWPTAISCEDLYIEILFENDLAGHPATCTIRALPSAEVVSNKTYTFGSLPFDLPPEVKESQLQLNVTEELPSTYVILFQVSSRCLYQVIEFNKTRISVPDCRNPPEVKDFEASFGDLQNPICRIPKTLNAVEKDVTWKWIYNCGEEMAENVVQRGGALEVTNVSFANLGKYMCIAQYEGKELAIREFDVCVKYKRVAHSPVVASCPEVVEIPLHGEATIECFATVATGKMETHYVNGAWFRGENLTEEICDSFEGQIKNSTVESEGSRIQCTMKSSAEKKCYTADTVEPPQVDQYTIILTIKNVKLSDFRTYRLSFGVLAEKNAYNVTLKQDKTLEHEVKVAGIVAAVCAVLLLLLIILIAVWRKHDIMWYWKKHFGPYEIEFLHYSAYFAYYYDTGKTEETMRKTKALVESLHDFMDKSRSTVYDDARNHNVHRFDVDNILQVHRDCHRIILVITPEFLTDEWSRFHLNSALHEVVESGRKAIFITIPEAKKALSSLDDASKKALVSAMKRNITIAWNGEIPLCGSFRRRLEYALPKLPKPGYDRFLSDSSQAHLTHYNKHATSNGENGEKAFSAVV